MKIRYRIIIGFFLLAGVSFYYLINWIIDDLRPRYLESVEEALVDEAHILASFASENFRNNGMEFSGLGSVFSKVNKRKFTAKIYKLTKKRVDLRVYLTDSNGVVVFDSENGKDVGKDYSQWRDVYLTLRGKYGARTSDRIVNDPGSSTLYVAAPVVYNGKTIGVLTVCKPTTSINFFLETAKPKIVIAGLIAALSVIVLSLIFSIWITTPINRLTEYARKIRDGVPAHVPKIKGGEFGNLASAFEEMRDALEGRKYVEQYVQTLTHELKSPLSGIRGASELLQENMPEEKRKQFLHNIETDANRIQDIVDRMLQLASIESRKKLEEYVEFNLRKMIEDLIKGFQPQLTARDIQVTINCKHDILLTGEKFLIRQSISNIIQNALDFSPEHSKIIIASSETPQGIKIEVEDEGPGIPEYATSKIFEKFFSLPRPETKTKSSGLGLNFIRQVMDLHCGSITVENKHGGGVTASLIFPSKSSITAAN